MAAFISCSSSWALSVRATQTAHADFIGEVSEFCSIVRLGNRSTLDTSERFILQGNHGSITSVCNIPSTLSVTVDKAASPIELQNAKIRFTGGNGIYTNAQTPYQETASFNSQNITSANGDTANLEVDTLAPRANSIVVYASLTAQ